MKFWHTNGYAIWCKSETRLAEYLRTKEGYTLRFWYRLSKDKDFLIQSEDTETTEKEAKRRCRAYVEQVARR